MNPRDVARRAAGVLALAGLLLGGSPGARPTAVPEFPLDRPGLLLRGAVEALNRGETERADELLAALAARHPVIADHADLLRIRLRVEAGRHQEAIAMSAGWQHAGSRLRADFHALLGKAFAAIGDEVAARGAWELARVESDSPERLAELHVAIAESYERSGELEAAARSYRRVWTTYPLSAEAETATGRLAALEREVDGAAPSAVDFRHRGDAFFRARRNEEALEAYHGALGSDSLSPAETRRARRQRAETLFRLRRYQEAAAAFELLPQDDEIRIARARCLARAGDVTGGARELERLARSARGRRAARAELLAGLLREGQGEDERARQLYTEVVQRAPHTAYAGAALWRLGWAAYREGRFEEAIGYLEQLLEREADPLAALRARYWRARAAERMGRSEAAAEFAALAREFPLSYYGWRARARADEGGDGAPPEAIAPGTSVLSPDELARPRILLEAGMEIEALAELDRLFVRAQGLRDRLALAQLYAEAGDFHRPQQLMVDAYQEPLARGPVSGQIDLWWHAWPAPYADAVRGATEERSGLQSELVYAVMREESGYRPLVVSVSGARGLLQLMPATAERVARGAGLADFSTDDLFLPQVNIRLGAAYLDQLLERFAGRASAAIGGYNAGPEAVRRWMDGAALDDDEWVEAIPYDQTRSYVKRVLRSLYAYQVLY